MIRKFLPLLVGIALACFGFAGSAMASTPLQPFITGGLSSNSSTAFHQIMSRAEVDPSMANEIAEQTGSTSFVQSNYKVIGWHKGRSGSNSGVSSVDGSVVPTADDANCNAHSTVLEVENTATGEKTQFCKACGNEGVHTVVPPKPHTFVHGTTLRLHLIRVISRKVCGVKVTFKVVVSGIVHASSTTKVIGEAKTKLKVAISKKIHTFISKHGKCTVKKIKVPVPTPTPVPVPTPSPTCTTGQYGTYPNCQTIPAIVSLQSLQEADVSTGPQPTQNYVFADVSGNFDKVVFTADLGTFENQGIATVDPSNGSDAWASTYDSPTEVPTSDPQDPSVPPGYDKITVTVYYNGGQTVSKSELVQITSGDPSTGRPS